MLETFNRSGIFSEDLRHVRVTDGQAYQVMGLLLFAEKTDVTLGMTHGNSTFL
jgi:hypothetical protein